MKEILKSANPYLPLWEHIPDGEPRVFEYNGEKRVYVYGSHDTERTAYCGRDQVVWSAPLGDLTDWTYHGGLVEINGQWYIFYHRQTGTDEFARQGMIEPVDIAIGKDGKIYIGDITYINGEPVSSKPVEMTSSGASVNGIDAYKLISAGYAAI